MKNPTMKEKINHLIQQYDKGGFTSQELEDELLMLISTETEPINKKCLELISLSDEFIFPSYYSHEDKKMWKISNAYTHYGGETLVLCGVDEGISKAIDLAIEHISKAKNNFYKK